MNSDGALVALRNITAVGRTLFVHARTPHAEDMAELVIVGGKDIQGSLQVTWGFGISCNSNIRFGTMWEMCVYHVGQESTVVITAIIDKKPNSKIKAEGEGSGNAAAHVIDAFADFLLQAWLCTGTQTRA